MWAFAEAQSLIAELEPHLRSVGVAIAMGGSVLHKGYSEKDLDIIVYPMNATRAWSDWPDDVQRVLDKAGFKMKCNRYCVWREWKVGNRSDDHKRVEVFKYKGRRVDVIYLGALEGDKEEAAATLPRVRRSG